MQARMQLLSLYYKTHDKESILDNQVSISS